MNREKKIGYIFIVLALVALGFVLSPFFGADLNDLGAYYVVYGAIALITAIISAISFFRLDKTRQKLMNEVTYIAHWRYPSYVWEKFQSNEYNILLKKGKSIFVIIAVLMLSLGVWMFIDVPDGGKEASLILFGATGLLYWLTFIRPKSQYEKNKNIEGDVIILPEGISVNKQLTTWNTFRGRFEYLHKVSGDLECLEFVYSIPSRYGRRDMKIRIPLPENNEESVNNVLEYFNAKAHKKQK